MEEKIKCPKCGSEQIAAGKHGYNLKKAAAGFVVTGGVGLLAGVHGSNKIDITCLKCGHKFSPGIQVPEKEVAKPINHTAGIILILIVVVIGTIILLNFT